MAKKETEKPIPHITPINKKIYVYIQKKNLYPVPYKYVLDLSYLKNILKTEK